MDALRENGAQADAYLIEQVVCFRQQGAYVLSPECKTELKLTRKTHPCTFVPLVDTLHGHEMTDKFGHSIKYV